MKQFQSFDMDSLTATYNDTYRTVADVKERIMAIVCFGPSLPHTGMRAGDYYQVTIDPDKRSPKGDYIRFGLYPGDEINGWQRCEAIHIVEELMSAEEVKLELEKATRTPNDWTTQVPQLQEEN